MDTRTPMLSVYKDTNLLEMLMLFQANSNRIALICDEKRKTASGIPSIMYTVLFMIIWIEKRHDHEEKGSKDYWGCVFVPDIWWADELWREGTQEQCGV